MSKPINDAPQLFPNHGQIGAGQNRVYVRNDRVQLSSWAPQGRKLPKLEGYKVVRDWFVRCQTTTATYARVRQYQSLTDDTKIFWQYRRLKGWLKPWKITMVGDDKTGLSYAHVENVLKHCRHYRLLIVEVAVDFEPSTGMNRRFVRQHAVFGKSRHEKRTDKTRASVRWPKD